MQRKHYVDATLEIFRRMSKDGKGERLFGKQDIMRLAKALDSQFTIGEMCTTIWEFPLYGEPYLDLLIGSGSSALRKNLEESDASYLASPYREAFSLAVSKESEDLCYGTELDLSTCGENFEPGFYMDHLANREMVRAVLAQLGVAAQRIAQADSFLDRVPSTWGKYYLGLFPNRPNTPLRLGFSVYREQIARYREEPSTLAQALQQIGYVYFDEAMLSELLDPVYQEFSWDVQFDLYPDGTLSPTMSISYPFMRGTTVKNALYIEGDLSQQFFQHLGQLGLVDERWRLLKDCQLYQHGYAFTEKGIEKFTLLCKFNFLKVKWRDRKPLPAKFYLDARVLPYSLLKEMKKKISSENLEEK